MTLLREDPAFAELLRTAGAQLSLPAALVEKDYWITQLLRAVSSEYATRFVFKGGTSLSKGFGLIDRFSEDVDLLLVPGQSDDAKDAVSRLMGELEGTFTGAVPGEVREAHHAVGRMRELHIDFPTQVDAADGVDSYLRVDYGVGGQPLPAIDRRVGSLLRSALVEAGQDPDQFQDLAEFSITALHPARTALEKVCLVHGLAARVLRGDTVRSRDARHYYDLFHLLDPDRSPVHAYVEQQGNVQPILNDCLRISEEHFGARIDLPSQPLANSPAFTDETVLGLVEKRYTKMIRELGFPNRDHPDLDAVLARIREHADLF